MMSCNCLLKCTLEIFLLNYEELPLCGGERGNLRSRRPPREYLGEYTSRGKPKIPPTDHTYEKKKTSRVHRRQLVVHQSQLKAAEIFTGRMPSCHSSNIRN